MDLNDLDYEIRRMKEDLERTIYRLENRVENLAQAVNELTYQLNTIANGDNDND